MTPPFHIAVLLGLCVGATALAAPPVYQLRAEQDLVGIRAGGALNVRVEGQTPDDGKALPTTATAGWSLVIAPCTSLDAGAARLVPQLATGGLFRLTVPAARSADDPHMCVARWSDGAIAHDPIRLRFCVGDLTLRECHPGWWDRHCKGLSAAECDRRAIAAGVKHDDEPSGLIYVERDGRRRKVPWTGGSGCPVHAARWGVVFARKGAIMALDIDGLSASPVMKPPKAVAYRSPFPDGRGGLLVVAESSAGKHLLRASSPCVGVDDCTLTTVRLLPSSVGRIVGRAGDAVLMTHRLSAHSVVVPLDPAKPAEQLTIAAPVGDCAVAIDGVRVTNDGAPPVAR